ncbi:FadR/GntR family transcriptional regulator [Bosea vestrisii]|uniref:FadR/GntR family transcriptional regulator n=1 Tax=Bosea vestrisii TaxID=151416 RepID=UPI0024DF62C8|nr:FadR/GntR family transcriptional regulator [Bosea vestrisii]WID95111.1 FadR/GntR family transcriptional regulator [Bosea vestrisii]
MHSFAVDRIAEWIVSERFPVGAALPIEQKLCEELGVSRTIVREAVKTLAAKGMVEVAPKLGSRVLPENLWNMFDPQVLGWRLSFREAGVVAEDLTELRLLFEPAAARFTATRASYSEKRAIRHAYEQMAEAEGRSQAFSKADIAFHTLILDACHNSFLRRLAPLVEILIQTTLDLYAEGGWDSEHIESASLPLHAALAEAISEGNADAAERAACAIIKTAQDDMRRAVTRLATKGTATS